MAGGISGYQAEPTAEEKTVFATVDALYEKKDFEAPGLAGGKGTIEATKPWLASNVQQLVVTTNPNGFSGAPDAKGLYGPARCPSPLGCWRTLPNSSVPLTYRLT